MAKKTTRPRYEMSQIATRPWSGFETGVIFECRSRGIVFNLSKLFQYVGGIKNYYC